MDGLVSVEDFEKAALSKLPKNAADYYKSGATAEQSLAENRAAFARLRIRPRCLVDVSNLDTSTTALGNKVKLPFGIAPTAMQRMAHPDGETASARAAGNLGTVFILSTIATSSIEEIAEAAPNAIKWFQLYIYIDRDVTIQLVRRAEKAGFKAIVLTVDTPFFGLRRADVRNKFSLPSHLKLANFEGLLSNKIWHAKSGSGLNEYVSNLFDNTLTWEDVKWLKSITMLPVVVKGILRGDDAKKAAQCGVAGIVVSNHGARQIDGTPSTIEVLSEVVEATKGTDVEIFLDGGVTQGTDVLKALSLGARMVFCGRPVLWGLANGGQAGVERVLGILKTEFEYALALSGKTRFPFSDKRTNGMFYIRMLEAFRPDSGHGGSSIIVLQTLIGTIE